MKHFIRNTITALVLSSFLSTAYAADLKTLDRVSVLMPKTEVISILGAPDHMADLGGLKVDLYMVAQAEPLVSAGYFYEHDLVLAGHSYIFRGDVTAHTAARMKTQGFAVQEEMGDYIRLIGKDDDTGRPIIVTISRLDDLTTVTTFDKGFYERRANK